MNVLALFLVFLCLNLIVMSGDAHRKAKYFLTPRHGSHFFIRLNTKVNILQNTAIFAYGSGFRLNWNIKIPHTNGLFHHTHQHVILHKSLEGTLEQYGVDGRACLIRAFCELIMIDNHDDLISHVLKLVFRTPYVGTCPQDIDCPLSLVTLAYLLYGHNTTIELVYCFLISTFGTADGIFTVGFTVGLAWEIPTDLREYVYKNGKEKLHARDRRHLYKKIELFLNKIGHDGRFCVLNAICNARKIKHKKLTLIETILRAIFSLVDSEHWQGKEDGHYITASRETSDCDTIFPCKLKLFNQFHH